MTPGNSGGDRSVSARRVSPTGWAGSAPCAQPGRICGRCRAMFFHFRRRLPSERSFVGAGCWCCGSARRCSGGSCWPVRGGSGGRVPSRPGSATTSPSETTSRIEAEAIPQRHPSKPGIGHLTRHRLGRVALRRGRVGRRGGAADQQGARRKWIKKIKISYLKVQDAPGTT